MTDEQRAALSPDDPEYEMRVLGSKIQIAGWTIYSTLVTVLKLAMAVFFLRLTVCLLPVILSNYHVTHSHFEFESRPNLTRYSTLWQFTVRSRSDIPHTSVRWIWPYRSWSCRLHHRHL